MDIPNLLFNPNGRIGVRDFWRGAILLTGFWILSQIVIAYGPRVLGGMLSLLTMASAYCYLCVYGKRLHDAGYSAWMYLLFFAAFVVLFCFVGVFMVMLIAPEGSELLMQWDQLRKRGEFQDAAALQPVVFRSIMSPVLIALLVSNGVLAYIGGKLQSDPKPNPYGAPTSPELDI